MSEHTVMKMQTTRKRKGQRERHRERERQGQRDAKSLHLEKKIQKWLVDLEHSVATMETRKNWKNTLTTYFI